MVINSLLSVTLSFISGGICIINCFILKVLRPQAITEQQAGAITRHGTEFDNYWLLELGQAHTLNSALNISGFRDFKFKLINREELVSTSTFWEHSPGRYAFLN